MARRVLTIPSVVLDRLSEESRAAVTADRATRSGRLPVEVRSVPGLETRANDDGTLNLSGYASVYDVSYPVAGGPERGGWNETVQRGAAAGSVAAGDDVRLLFDHGGVPMARTRSGTLTVRSDDNGVYYSAPSLDGASPLVQTITSAVRRGDVDQSSVAFRVLDQSWNDDYTERTITGMELFDVSPVTYPASEATVVQMNTRAVSEVDEPNLVEQIEALVAQLIQSEADEIIAGGEAAGALSALVRILNDLDCYEMVDEMEDAATPDGGGMSMMSAMPLGLALAQADALRSA